MPGTVLDGLRELVALVRGRLRRQPPQEVDGSFKAKYDAFLRLLESNTELLRIIAEMEEAVDAGKPLGPGVPRTWASRAVFHALRMASSFETLVGRPEPALLQRLEAIQEAMEAAVRSAAPAEHGPWVIDVAALAEEHEALVGGKAAALGRLARAGFPVPQGFVVTTAACAAVLRHGETWEEIQRLLLAADPGRPELLSQAAQELRAVVASLAVPEALEQAMLEAMDALAARCGLAPEAVRVAVRSSAEGEDGTYSFAGQYETVLGVSRAELLDAYRRVLASLFSPEALAYRALLGMDIVAMAVLVQEMIPARAAGVLFTRDPRDGEAPTLVLDAAWGLGVAVVDGLVVPDRWELERTDGGVRVAACSLGQKAVRVVMTEAGVEEQAVPEALQQAPCLDDATVLRLGELGVALEAHGGGPQDVEWVEREDGGIAIVQSRPLACGTARGPEAVAVDAPLLAEGGEAAYPGVGAGPVYRVQEPGDLAGFPQGAVLVASHSSPEYLVALPKAAAVVTEFGSVTGHMASLCRELHVPSLLGVPQALERLEAGALVTVDARGCRIYAGQVAALLEAHAPRRPPVRRSGPVDRAARALYDLVVPLRLVDPKAPEFSPAGCRTIHDIMRYLHERSYAEMFRFSDMVADHHGATLRLDAPTGLDLHIIDLGGAIAPGAGGTGWVRPDDVISRPFAALLQGLVLGEEALRQPRPVHLGGLLSVLREQAVSGIQPRTERFGDKSYAIVSDKYLNFSSRVGYHYGVLDCYCGTTVSKNYISFVFKGGAADDTKRSRRARAIAAILARLHFRVETIADQSFARFHKAGADAIAERLVHLGRLLQYTRQADMLMVSESCVDAMVESFFRGDPYFCTAGN